MSNKRSCASTRATDIPFSDPENPLSTTSNKRSCNLARAADSTIIDLDYTIECLFFAATPSSLCGELNVNDANSPGGKRTTRIYSLTTVDMTDQTVVFEYWGANSDKAERYFRANNRPDGTVYALSEIDRNLLQCVETVPTAYQANNLLIHRKFVMGTADGSPKKDLVLTRAAMPKPVDFLAGRFRARGIVLQNPRSRASLSSNQESDGFDEEVEVISSDVFIQEKRSRSE